MKGTGKIAVALVGAMCLVGLGIGGVSYADTGGGTSIPVKNQTLGNDAGVSNPAFEAWGGGWSPFLEMEALLRQMSDLFEKTAQPGQGQSTIFAPRLDLADQGDHYVIKMDIPGMDKNKLDVVVTEGALTVSGERKMEEDTNQKGFYRVERSYGSFERTVLLPEDADDGSVSAKYDKGVLTIEIAKKASAETKESRKIAVQ